jgi:hypothetical protein
MTKQIDWTLMIGRATDMTSTQLHYAILDCQKTLPFADDLDRTDGGTRGGYYRDEISVYRAEQKSRRDR